MIFAMAAFVLSSATFQTNTTLPTTTVYARCGGGNRSPELHWQNPPPRTKSFALISFDPDVTGGWYHWVVYNLSATTRSLRAGAQLPASELGTTSFKETAYGGPCPPPGKVHHYVFTLYALNVSRLGRAGMTGPKAEAAMRKHVLAHVSLTGLYRR